MEETDTLRQALEKMEHHGYAAVPLLSTEGKYLGTLTDGDVLWGLKELNFADVDFSIRFDRRKNYTDNGYEAVE